MPDSLHTTLLHNWLKAMQGGDLSAREELLRCVGDRLERLARKMLRDFPRVRRWADTGDVLQNAVIRLLRSLQEVQPASVREFFGLAAEQIRRELLDLARHFHGPLGDGANLQSHGPQADSRPAFDPADSAEDADDLAKWCAFHEAVANLPTEEREVVGLIFYHGWTQIEVAELFQVAERTVRRWWVSAQLKLQQHMKHVQEDT
jgi:RNA polymerase sigma factor (sigma-70 family)